VFFYEMYVDFDLELLIRNISPLTYTPNSGGVPN
jgi:hypothetical protein